MISIILPAYNRKDLLYNTLQGYEYLYGNNSELEVVVVDDCSNIENQFPNIALAFPGLNINYHRIDIKCGYNPSLAYNVGARKAKGDIFILSSPETMHIRNIFDLCNNFKNFKEDDYYIFSVFCLTDKEYKSVMLEKVVNYGQKIDLIESIAHLFEKDLGCNGYSFNNNFGSWYLHSVHRPSKLNFLTALSRELYYEISGFNESFMQGTGYDDADFLARLSPKIKETWFDAVAIHIDHDLAEKVPQETNQALFESLQQNQTYTKNDDWGII